MAIFKNPNGKWYARVSTGVRTPSGNYKYVTSKHGFATQQEAKLDEAELRLHVAGSKASVLSNMTVHELLDRYFATKAIRKTTARTYRSSINHLKKVMPDIPVRDVTPMHIESIRQTVLSEPLSDNTHRDLLSLTKVVFKWAHDMELIVKNPARNMPLPPKPEAKGMHIEMDLLMEILRTAKKYKYSQLYIPLLLAGLCGLRISEVCGLQDYNIAQDNIQVQYNYLRAGSVLSLQPLKTKAAARVIPLIPFVAGEIEEYKDFIKAAKKIALKRRQELSKNPGFLAVDPAWHPGHHLFVCPENGQPIAKEFVERHWKLFKGSLALRPLIEKHPEIARMRLHDFRHTFGSNLRHAGAPIEDVAELLGHTNSNFTRITYAIPLKGTHERSMQRFGALAVKNL